ncbi:MAG: N-formylglutamate amidohydrolase [Alphaproteobacteria bacterium]
MSGTVTRLTPRRPALLGPDDPAPFEVVNGEGRARAVLFCDHASRAVPKALDNLGLDESLLERHIGWDIGAGDVTRRLAALIDAPAVLAGFSRLVIDCNRPPDSPDSIPRVSDGVAVPGNAGVDEAAARGRAGACFWPYHDAVDETITGVGERFGGPPMVISMHSFTPVMDGFERPWHVSVLSDRDAHAARALIDALAADPAICVGDNQPYSGRVPVPYSIPTHAAAPGRPHVTIEIRQDLIDTHHGAEAWANIVAAALGTVLADPGLYRWIEG